METPCIGVLIFVEMSKPEPADELNEFYFADDGNGIYIVEQLTTLHYARYEFFISSTESPGEDSEEEKLNTSPKISVMEVIRLGNQFRLKQSQYIELVLETAEELLAGSIDDVTFELDIETPSGQIIDTPVFLWGHRVGEEEIPRIILPRAADKEAIRNALAEFVPDR